MSSFLGTASDDRWNVVEVGRYVIDALGGTDTVAFGIQPRSAFEITRDSAGAIHVDTVSSASGGGMQAVLYSVEVLVFDNGLDRVGVVDLFPQIRQLGGPGNDRFAAVAGTQFVDGAGGIDEVVFESERVHYLIGSTGSSWSVNATAGGTSLVLADVERLIFADYSLALDLHGHAGVVAKVLGAVFDSPTLNQADFRTYAGIGLSLLDSGQCNDESLMQLALDTRLGPGASFAAVVDLLYANIVGVAPSDATRAAFVALLDDHTYTPATLGMFAADHDLNLRQIDFAGLELSGLPYT